MLIDKLPLNLHRPVCYKMALRFTKYCLRVNINLAVYLLILV
jgi:hypothetical protein